MCMHFFPLSTGGEIVLGVCARCGARKYHANVMRDRTIARVEMLNSELGIPNLRWRKRDKREEYLLEKAGGRWTGGPIFLEGEDE